jgi:hypothetical protein
MEEKEKAENMEDIQAFDPTKKKKKKRTTKEAKTGI